MQPKVPQLDEKEFPSESVPYVNDPKLLRDVVEFHELPSESVPFVNVELPSRLLFWLQLEPVRLL